MSRVVRVVRALGAGALVVWGLAKTLRRRPKDAAPADPAPGWPPSPANDAPPAEAARPVEPVAAAPAAAVPPEEPVDTDDSASEPPDEIVLKGVAVRDPAKLLAFANGASDDALKDAGIKGKALQTLLDARPYASVGALGDTAGVGRRTLQALCEASGA